MGLFGGMNEDELRVSGTPVSARVTYSDDTGKRRDDGAKARLKLQLKIDSGSARGRELEQAKWVPADRIPRVGETVQIRVDPDDLDDWAWGDAAMYAAPMSAPAVAQRPGGSVRRRHRHAAAQDRRAAPAGPDRRSRARAPAPEDHRLDLTPGAPRGKKADRAPVVVRRSRACPPVFDSDPASPRRASGIP
jgi:hypothetical protein